MEIEKNLAKVNIVSLILMILAIINIILLFVINKILPYLIGFRSIEIVMLLLVIRLNNKGKNWLALIIYIIFNILLFSHPLFLNIIDYGDLWFLNYYFYKLLAIFNIYYVLRIMRYLYNKKRTC
jgi:hypothetical protein